MIESGSSPGGEGPSEERKRILEKAEELGRMLGQTAEYRYLRAAEGDISDDREATELLNRARELQESVMGHLERGEQPPEEMRREMEELREKLERNPRYRSVLSSRSNFDKLMARVHDAIGKGLRKGRESRIVMPS